jgi:cytochrome P450
MTATAARLIEKPGLYPPTVPGFQGRLSLPTFLLHFVRNPLTSLPQAIYEEGIVVYDGGRFVTVFVSDPALIEEVLLHRAEQFPKTLLERRIFERLLGDGILTSQGASWRWQRRTAAPLFRPADLASLVPAMSAAGAAQLARWSARPPGTLQPIDRDMSETTFQVISHTMFAGSADREAAEIMQSADIALSSVSWDIAAALVHLPAWVWYPGKYKRRRAGDRLRAAVSSLLDRRRAEGLGGDDLLARLARAQDPETGAPMSEAQLIDNLVTFLIAGHETTAKALTWTLYLLARAPEWQERIRREVHDIAGDGPVGAGHLERLVVTRAVLEESMRLYPPAPVLTREAAAATQLGGRPIPAGGNIVISLYAVHRHRRLWEDPDRFDPERFMPERKAKLLRTQFMPFGFGARTCIGASFAIMEGVALLAALVRGAELEWDGRHLPEPLSRVTLRPRGGMPLRTRLLDTPHLS